jgi:hypothetical protein
VIFAQAIERTATAAGGREALPARTVHRLAEPCRCEAGTSGGLTTAHPLLGKLKHARFDDSLSAPLHVQFATDIQDVFLDGVHTERQLTGNLSIGSPIQQQPQHVALACSKWFHEQTGLGGW